MQGELASPTAELDSRVVSICQRLREIYERVSQEPVGLDETDTEVVLDFIDLALERSWCALVALHPELEGMDDDEYGEAFHALEQEHASERTCPRDDPREDLEFVTMLVSLSAVGVEKIADGQRTVSREVGDEMESVIEAMCFLMYVLGGDGEPDEDLSPQERVQRAYRLEQYELMLEEARERARVVIAYAKPLALEN
jgi:hypothetical protein